MDILSRAHILKFHTDSIKAFGAENEKAVGWKNKQAQATRFAELLKIGDLKGSTVLDIGCANGDLVEYLLAGNIFCQYTGIDHVKEFIEFAADKYKDAERVSFL